MSALKRLHSKQGKPISKTIAISKHQKQTRDAFGFKWSKRESYESKAFAKAQKQWLIERYLNNDPKLLDFWLRNGNNIIVDVGCGSGWSGLIFFEKYLKDNDYLGVDISESIEVGRKRFKERGLKGEFLQADLMKLPIPDNSIDMLFAEGVLHHTDSTKNAIIYLTKKLRKGGRFLFYVYAKKAVIREFTDDYIRKKLKSLSDEDFWQAMEPLTKFGKTLGKLNVTIDVPEDIPYLGIKKGPIDLQRFFYWNIAKMYYRPEFSLDEMNHINFDWFRPLNCHRQTPNQVKRWCKQAGLFIEHIKIEEAGITVVGIKQ